MSRTINRIELLGRVGTDPELRKTQNGTAVVQLRLATDRRNGNEDPQTDWHTVVCWDKQAEAVPSTSARASGSTSPAASTSTAGRPTPASAAAAPRSTPTK